MRIPVPPHFEEADVAAWGEDVRIGKYDASLSSSSSSRSSPASSPGEKLGSAKPASEYDLSIALNYGQANGSAQMMRFVTEHVELVGSAPPYADWRTCLTVGSTGALEQALRMLCDGPGRGDALLTEEYSFSTALETAAPLGVRVVGVPMDAQGLLPDRMDEILARWDPARRGGARKPHVLYTVPSGQNPTGATQGERRRREVYEVCQRHDVIIIEDDPYYYLQMPPLEPGAGETTRGTPPETESVDDFLDSLIPTLLSMDVDGRVLRMDSFSKVVVPGSRLGWVTASEQMVERFIRHAEVANQGPSGFSQAVLHKLLDERWGHEGYLRWLMYLRREYTRRRDVMVAACERFLPGEVVIWNPPRAGMFVSFLFPFQFDLFLLPFLSFFPVTCCCVLLIDVYFRVTLALAQGRPHAAPARLEQEHPGDRGRHLQQLPEEGRARGPRVLVPGGAGQAPERPVLPRYLCCGHAREYD